MNELASKFHRLFAGEELIHGTCEIAEDKKIAAKTVKEPVTDEIWSQHLDGTRNLGIIPIRADGTCVFGMIDLDPQVDPEILIAQMKRGSFPLIVVKSKSGGVHLCQFSRPVTAKAMRDKLRGIADSAGHPNAEIYPKQEFVAPGSIGSWILMPYFNAGYTKRYAISQNGKRMSAVEFLEQANIMRGA